VKFERTIVEPPRRLRLLLAIPKPLTPLPDLFSTTNHSGSTTEDWINSRSGFSRSSSLDLVFPRYTKEAIAHLFG
jgi:hypothetical protein